MSAAVKTGRMKVDENIEKEKKKQNSRKKIHNTDSSQSSLDEVGVNAF